MGSLKVKASMMLPLNKPVIYLTLLVTFATAPLTKADEVLVLGNESMPFNGIVDGKNSGIAVEILTQATNYGAPRFKFRLGLPWKRAQKMLNEAHDRPTAIIPFTRTPEREGNYLWIAPLINYQPRFNSFKKQEVTLSDMLDARIGIIRGSAHLPLLKQLGFNNLQVVEKAQQNILKLQYNRIDAILESQFVDTYHWRQAGVDTNRLRFIPVGDVKQIYIAGNLKFSSAMAKKIADAIDLMESNGELQAIVGRWER